MKKKFFFNFWKKFFGNQISVTRHDFSNINVNFSNINEISCLIFKSFDEKIWKKIEKKSAHQLQNQKYFGEMIGLQ